MYYLMSMVLCLLSIKRSNYNMMNPVMVDAIIVLSFTGLLTSMMGFISSLLQLLGWLTQETSHAIAVCLILNIPLIAPVIAGLIILFYEFELISVVATYKPLISSTLNSLKPSKTNSNVSKDEFLSSGSSKKKM